MLRVIEIEKVGETRLTAHSSKAAIGPWPLASLAKDQYAYITEKMNMYARFVSPSPAKLRHGRYTPGSAATPDWLRAERLRQRGFTLIELLIAIVIVGILVAVAIPSYLQYVIRANRAAAESQMMDIASREQQIFLSNRAYGTLADLGYSSFPSELNGKYSFPPTLNIDNTATPPTFTITFTAIGSQASDGNLTLDYQGNKTPPEKW
jgi:type IV pilus assembly protein PilE